MEIKQISDWGYLERQAVIHSTARATAPQLNILVDDPQRFILLRALNFLELGQPHLATGLLRRELEAGW